MDKRKLALVGIGKIARDQHLPSIEQSAEWDLAAAVSRNERVDGVPNYTDMSEMLAAHPEITTVSLCMPPRPRFAYAAMALEAGRHVMLEKPPGATLSEVETLRKMAEERNLTLYATWHSRHAHFVPTAKSLLQDAQITSLHVEWKEDVRKWHPGQDWVFEPGGMGVFDPGINALSIVTEILPDPIHITSAELDFPANRDAPIAARLKFRHSRGAEVTMECDWDHSADDIWRIDVRHRDGSLVLEGGGASLTVDGAPVEKERTGLSGEYPRLYARMAELIEHGKSDVDVSPLRHVADAYMIGKHARVALFDW